MGYTHKDGPSPGARPSCPPSLLQNVARPYPLCRPDQIRVRTEFRIFHHAQNVARPYPLCRRAPIRSVGRIASADRAVRSDRQTGLEAFKDV